MNFIFMVKMNRHFFSFTKIIVISIVFVCGTVNWTNKSLAQNSGFVSSRDTTFILNNKPFQFIGANCYYLMVYAADVNLRIYVDEVLEEAKEIDLKVIRTWAFNDGAEQWNALQTEPGVYQEYVFKGLDYVLAKADLLSLRLILPFVNNWNDYGGMNQYVQWSSIPITHDDFYTDDSTKIWYKNHIFRVLNRINTITGRKYKEDPSIFAWELANEPRCSSDMSGHTLHKWISEMSSYVKSLDQNHMVTTGIEGFYNDTNPELWMNDQGTDFIANHMLKTIDFVVAHSWPDHWGWGNNSLLTTEFVKRQINDAHSIINKPFVLEEFGKKRPIEERNNFFATYLNSLKKHNAGGALIWILYHDKYEDYDGFGIYHPADKSTINIIKSTNFFSLESY